MVVERMDNSMIESDGTGLVRPASHFPQLNSVSTTRLKDNSSKATSLEETISPLTGLEENLDQLSVSPEHTNDYSWLTRQDENGDTYLHLCIIHNKLAEISQIPERVVQESLNIQNYLGQTPLHLAVINNNVEVAQTLIKHGASLIIPDIPEGRTPLHIACELSEHNIHMVRLLASALRRCEFEFVNAKGETYLHTAAQHGRIDIIQCLVDNYGHDINIQETNAGKSILHLAIEGEKVDLLRFLLGHRNICLTDDALVLAHYRPVSWEVIVQCRPDLEMYLRDRFYNEHGGVTSDDEMSVDEDS